MMRHTNWKKWHHKRRKNALLKQESGLHHRVWRPTGTISQHCKGKARQTQFYTKVYFPPGSSKLT